MTKKTRPYGVQAPNDALICLVPRESLPFAPVGFKGDLFSTEHMFMFCRGLKQMEVDIFLGGQCKVLGSMFLEARALCPSRELLRRA